MPAPRQLPDSPNLEWLKKSAKERLAELRRANPKAKLADAQRDVARSYAFKSWRALKARVDASVLLDELGPAWRAQDAARLGEFFDQHPERLKVRLGPQESWTLLHVAAKEGNIPALDVLLERGLDVNAREPLDNTYPIHWAAAEGRVDVVRRLADAGGDVIGAGDDHQFEVIGWASCWDGCDDDRHREVQALLIERGARHHIFSAIAMNLGDEVRRIVAADPAQLVRPMSHNDGHQLPLHWAVRRNRPEMVSLLLELGADPEATDPEGFPAVVHAMSPSVDRGVLEVIARAGRMNLAAAVALGDWAAAERLMVETRNAERPNRLSAGALHLMAKRGDVQGVQWLLDHGADPNARWAHWGAEVTPLHLTAFSGSIEIARLLLAAGAEPAILDSEHQSDAAGWAEHFGKPDLMRVLKKHGG